RERSPSPSRWTPRRSLGDEEAREERPPRRAEARRHSAFPGRASRHRTARVSRVSSATAEGLEGRALFYERFADAFDSEMNRYEVGKRLALIFDDVLADHAVHGKRLLDAGC